MLILSFTLSILLVLIVIEFNENYFKNIDNIDKLFNIKLEYSDTRYPKCDYNKKGSLLPNNSIKTYVLNVNFPTNLFRIFHIINYDNLVNLYSDIKKIFKN